jgi:ribose 5-phosphate isomerase B
MKVAVGADHAGFVLKEHLRRRLEQEGHQVVDEGTDSTASCDYPDFAALVAHDVTEGRAERGILVCGTGIGMSIAANKISGIRAAMGTVPEEVRLSRAHNDANILTLGARFIEEPAADALVDVFLATAFDDGRHSLRVAKIAALEGEQS